MRLKSALLILLLGLAGATVQLSSLVAAEPHMPLSEIRPGMVGIGRTVFDGTRLEEFKVNIIGVVENLIGPQRNLILAKLEGGPLAQTGVIAGMSGSPVYVDGRLIGAVAFSLGSFPKEPIAGITPIEEMTAEMASGGVRPPGARVQLDLPLTQDNLIAAFRRALNWNRPFANRPGDARVVSAGPLPGFDGAGLATMMRPIATPLVMSGFQPEVADIFSAAFRDQGFVPMGGAAGKRPGEMAFDGPLKAGDAVGVTFVNGDLLLGATGTVTHIDGDQVYAFGHPMYNLGPIDFPMTRAYMYAILPSLFNSVKLSSTSEVVGSFLQDRATGIAGRLGAGPKLIPVTLTLEPERGSKRTFNFGVVRDQMFTPLMTYATLLNTLVSYERQYGTATYVVQGKAQLDKYGSIAFDNLFSGLESPSLGAASYVVAPLAALIGNDYEKVNIDALDLTIKSVEEARTATLERVWVDDPRPRPGRDIPVKVLLRTYRGEDILRTIPIQIPNNATGNLTLMVSDGLRLSQIEQRESRSTQPRTVPQLLRTISKGRRNNTVYVKLLGSEAGAVVNGELLSSLPPSVLAVVESERSGASFTALNSATLGEWEIQTEQAVTGMRTLTLSVTPN